MILDANTLIDANRDYYGIGQVNEYWEWLIHSGEKGHVRNPVEMYEELKAGSDNFADWAKTTETEAALKFEEEVDIDLVRRVMEEGYAPDLTDIEILEIGRDPFLVAYALVDTENRVIVTTGRSRPGAQRKTARFLTCADSSASVRAMLSILAMNSASEQTGKIRGLYRWVDGAVPPPDSDRFHLLQGSGTPDRDLG